MNCPHCGGQTRVADSRHKEWGIKRKRECLEKDCGKSFNTWEYISTDSVIYDAAGLEAQ